MNKIIYYVASSIDGYISGPDDDVSQFAQKGEAVEHYFKDLKDFKTVIMGRRTYEMGYKFGLKEGQAVYPTMKHFIFSNSLKFRKPNPQVCVCPISIDKVNEIKAKSESNIYLCGGGEFSGWLLKNGLVDQIKLKLNPITLGSGIKLFGSLCSINHWELHEYKAFKDGLMLLTYNKLT